MHVFTVDWLIDRWVFFVDLKMQTVGYFFFISSSAFIQLNSVNKYKANIDVQKIQIKF